MSNLQEQIQLLLEPILSSLGLTLWDLDFKKEGPQWLLRVYIEREPGGVTLGDCETVSRDLGTALDVEDIIPHAYTLEVSSPGLDRSLTKPEALPEMRGTQVKVKTYQLIMGKGLPGKVDRARRRHGRSGDGQGRGPSAPAGSHSQGIM